MSMSPRCSMYMLWNTNIVDTCVVFRQWHISSTSSFIFSCLIIVALGVLYEYLRAFQKSFDRRIAASLSGTKGKGRIRLSGSSGSGRSTPESNQEEESGLLNGGGRKIRDGTSVPAGPRALRALLYGATVFLSFFLMLVFMTYNAYLILAVVVGAALGHYIFGGHMDLDATSVDAKGMACH